MSKKFQKKQQPKTLKLLNTRVNAVFNIIVQNDKDIATTKVIRDANSVANDAKDYKGLPAP